ncbi:MAG: TonB-dependent receptor [bacterium]|nr:TonB-dependent receptor [bacterium]
MTLNIHILLRWIVLAAALGQHDYARASDLESLSLDSLMGIHVTAVSKHDQTTLEAPASVTVITSAEIEQYGWQTLEEALNSVRGFYVTDDLNYTSIGMRGYQRPSDYSNRLLMLLNGQALNENTQGMAPLGSIFALDLQVIDRIEIARGPGSSLYGTNAMFAVVNVVTKDASTKEGVTVGGTVGTPRGAASNLYFAKRLPGEWSVALGAMVCDQRGDDVYLEPYDDPETNNGVVKGLDWERRQGLFLSSSRGRLRMQGYYTQRWKGIPTASWSTVFNDSRSKSWDMYGGGQVEYSRTVHRKMDVIGRAYYNTFRYDGVYPYEPESPDNVDYQREKRAGVEVRSEWSPVSYERLITGVEFVRHMQNDYYSSTSEEVFSNESHPYHDFSAFVQNEYQFSSKAMLTAGLRQSWYSLGWKALVPRTALVYLPGRKSAIKLLYGQAYRTPTVLEAYYWYPEQAKANPDLTPERLNSLELCLEQRLIENLFGTISIYGFHVNNLISSAIDDDDGLVVFRNEGEIAGEGIEGELTYRRGHGISGFLSYSYQHTVEEPNAIRITNSPYSLLKAGVGIPFARRFRIAADGQAESSRRTLLNDETPAFGVLNLAFTMQTWQSRLLCTAFVRNAFDTSYFHAGSWDNLKPTSAENLDMIPQRGRQAGLRVQLSF